MDKMSLLPIVIRNNNTLIPNTIYTPSPPSHQTTYDFAKDTSALAPFITDTAHQTTYNDASETFSFTVGILVVMLTFIWLCIWLFKKRVRIVNAFKVLVGLSEPVPDIESGGGVISQAEDENEVDEDEEVPEELSIEHNMISDGRHNRLTDKNPRL